MSSNAILATQRADGKAALRSAEASAAIPRAAQFAPPAADELLARRARALEQPPAAESAPSEMLSIVTFKLAGEQYGIEAQSIREIVRVDDLTPLPGAPLFEPGVMNLRGKVIRVVDLRVLFEISARGLVDLPRAIVLGGETADFAILVSDVQEFASLPQAELREPSALFAGIPKELIKGVSPSGTLVFDGRKLSADPRLFFNKPANPGSLPERR